MISASSHTPGSLSTNLISDHFTTVACSFKEAASRFSGLKATQIKRALKNIRQHNATIPKLSAFSSVPTFVSAKLNKAITPKQ